MKSVLAIVGTTGVGKTKLSLQLAKALNGEIINADSMQVYAGLPIMTNKPTPNELLSAPHHLLGHVDPLSREYSVPEFQKDALSVINSLHAQHKLPIIVGGTHYYIQALLWHQQLIAAEESLGNSLNLSPHPSLDHAIKGELQDLLGKSDPRRDNYVYSAELAQSLHTLLCRLDPVMAQKWHVNDIRKVRRSLEVFYSSGEPHSKVMAEQSKSLNPRFKTCIIWPSADLEVLGPRLDDRVSDMIQRGIFEEIHGFLGDLGGSARQDFTRGALQTIGFKEFRPYLEALESLKQNPSMAFPSDHLEKLKMQGLEDMKLHTRQYAKRQTHWIRNKLLTQVRETGLDSMMFLELNATDLDQWDQNVQGKAIEAVKDFMAGKIQSSSQTLDTPPDSPPPHKQPWVKHFCSICTDKSTGKPRVLNGDHEWAIHLRSRSHKTRGRRAARVMETSCPERPQGDSVQ